MHVQIEYVACNLHFFVAIPCIDILSSLFAYVDMKNCVHIACLKTLLFLFEWIYL